MQWQSEYTRFCFHISRSEHHPEVGFTRVTKMRNMFVVFLDLLGAIKNADPARYVSYCSLLLVNNIVHQMNNKLLFKIKCQLSLEKFH